MQPVSFRTLTLRERRTNPDVPRDVEEDIREHLLHLNDPNWDFGHSETSTLSGESVELEHKHNFPPDVHIGPSIGTAPSDFDTESRADSTYEPRSSASSRLRMRAADTCDEYEE